MAEAVSSWIAKAVVQHDRKHGANLGAVTDRIKRLVQITKFHTYRSEHDPRAQVTGLISDKTHCLPVVFDVDATDEFESPDSDLPPERLTANLRSILKIKSYRWRLGPPPTGARQVLELPVLSMEILDFEIHSGGPDSPVYFENVVDVGRAKEDGDVQKVLRKWYFGESNSDPSQVDKSFEMSQPEAGPSKPILSSPSQYRTTRPLPEGIISLSDFFEPYISDLGSKKGKIIPEYIFHTTNEIERQLAEVGMFGLDFEQQQAGPSTQPLPPSSAASLSGPGPGPSPRRLDKGKQRDVDPPHPSLQQPELPGTQSDTPPVPPGQRPQSTQTVTQPTHPTQDADDEDSEDEMPIRPLPSRPATQKRRPVFASSPAPLPFPAPASGPGAAAAASDHGMEEDGNSTDSDMLSEYEKEQRKTKRPRSRGPEQRPSPHSQKHARIAEPQPQLPEHDSLPLSNQSESLPASNTPESYSLSKQFPSPRKQAQAQQVITTDVQMTTEAVVVRTQMEQSSLESNQSKRTTDSYATPPPSSSPKRRDLPAADEEEEEEYVEEEEEEEPPATKVEPISPVAADPRPRTTAVERFKLDMTVDGLSEAQAQAYLVKIRELRARRSSTAPAPAPAPA